MNCDFIEFDLVLLESICGPGYNVRRTDSKFDKIKECHMPVKMKFYNNVNSDLQKYISHYWTTVGSLDAEKSYKILPMDHIDLIMPIKGDSYHLHNKVELVEAPEVFFHGMKDEISEVVRHGYVECIGISFKPWGFYPFIKKDLSAYQNRSVDFKLENVALSIELTRIGKKISDLKDSVKIQAVISEIEAVLLKDLEVLENYSKTANVLAELCRMNDGNIEGLVKKHNLTMRTVERMFNKYIGISPKAFYKIRQFEQASRSVLYNEDSTLTDIAYDSNYYDQAHFSKTFKKYTQETARSIRQKKTALKSNIKFTE